MGFSAHLRYHWMENIIYRGLTFLPLSLLHANPSDLYGLYVFTILVGHLNHSNLKLNYGPLRYLLNHPTMHLWHHAKDWGPKHPHGLNFGISLSLWDGLFGTARWETPPAELPLSFKHRELYPNAFMAQNMNLRGPVFKSKTEPSRPRDEANIK
jgi:sterol desaturase/sphingolipid hydroxylase (fatty acid hydroxylase superfamily)